MAKRDRDRRAKGLPRDYLAGTLADWDHARWAADRRLLPALVRHRTADAIARVAAVILHYRFSVID